MGTASHLTRIRRGTLSLAILALLAFTLGSVAFSGASYTSVSANPANVVVTGALLHSNSQDGLVAIAADGLAPGDSSVGTMTITGAGTVGGAYTLSVSDLVDTPATPRLSDALTLTVQDVSGAPQTLYSGAVSALPDVSLGSIGAGASRVYRLTVAYPAGTARAELQGSSLTLGLRITGVSQ
jgi:hypothetical protein